MPEVAALPQMSGGVESDTSAVTAASPGAAASPATAIVPAPSVSAIAPPAAVVVMKSAPAGIQPGITPAPEPDRSGGLWAFIVNTLTMLCFCACCGGLCMAVASSNHPAVLNLKDEWRRKSNQQVMYDPNGDPYANGMFGGQQQAYEMRGQQQQYADPSGGLNRGAFGGARPDPYGPPADSYQYQQQQPQPQQGRSRSNSPGRRGGSPQGAQGQGGFRHDAYRTPAPGYE